MVPQAKDLNPRTRGNPYISNRMSDHRGLLSLPSELLQVISSNLHPQDVKTFRAANKQIRTVASPYLFRRVHIALRPQTCAIFQKIVCHPVFSQNVTEIVFDASQFLDNIDVMRRLLEREGVTRCTHKDDKRCNSVYEQLYQEQERLRSHKRFLPLLTLATSKLCRLHSFDYSSWQGICEKSQSSWYLNKGPMSWDLDTNVVCLPAIPGWSNSLPQIPLDEILSSFSSRYKIKHFTQDIDSISQKRRLQPSHLRLYDLLPNDQQFEQAPRSSKDILTFKAAIWRDRDDVFYPAPGVFSAFSTLLSSFSSLHRLELSVNMDCCLLVPPTPYPNAQYFFLKDLYWPHLYSLILDGEICTWIITPENFLDFLGRQGMTLRHLSLEGFDLVALVHTWVDIIKPCVHFSPIWSLCILPN